MKKASKKPRINWSRKSVAVGEIGTKIGALTIHVGPHGLLRIDLPGKRPMLAKRLPFRGLEQLPVVAADDRVREAGRQLREYFDGKRTKFRLPLDPRGSEFDRSVWQAVATVEYGQVATYGDVAEAIGRSTAFRAVGAANGRNPLPIVIPCHRIIGASGKLTGYGGGLELKARLLRLEGHD